MESAPPLRNEFNPEAHPPASLITITDVDAKPPDGVDRSLEAIILTVLPEAINELVYHFTPSPS